MYASLASATGNVCTDTFVPVDTSKILRIGSPRETKVQRGAEMPGTI